MEDNNNYERANTLPENQDWIKLKLLESKILTDGNLNNLSISAAQNQITNLSNMSDTEYKKSFDRNSISGESAKFIISFQLLLKNKGFYTGKLDGVFGSKTKQSLKKFQRSTGMLTVDGLPSPATASMLLNNYNGNGIQISSIGNQETLVEPKLGSATEVNINTTVQLHKALIQNSDKNMKYTCENIKSGSRIFKLVFYTANRRVFLSEYNPSTKSYETTNAQKGNRDIINKKINIFYDDQKDNKWVFESNGDLTFNNKTNKENLEEFLKTLNLGKDVKIDLFTPSFNNRTQYLEELGKYKQNLENLVNKIKSEQNLVNKIKMSGIKLKTSSGNNDKPWFIDDISGGKNLIINYKLDADKNINIIKNALVQNEADKFLSKLDMGKYKNGIRMGEVSNYDYEDFLSKKDNITNLVDALKINTRLCDRLQRYGLKLVIGEQGNFTNLRLIDETGLKRDLLGDFVIAINYDDEPQKNIENIQSALAQYEINNNIIN